MFSYYLGLALRSLKRNVALTALMIAAIGVGIGASMTVFTVLRAMSSDPIPAKSSQLFEPLIDNWGPDRISGGPTLDDRHEVSYRDALAWMQAQRGAKQAAMYGVAFSVMPTLSDAKPFPVDGRAAATDFFPMFAVPFRSGGPWSRADDDARANVVVISSKLADRLFPHRDAVGETINLDQHDYRIVGVIGNWNPVPRYYDVTNDPYAEPEDVFLPFSTAIAQQRALNGNNNCNTESAPGWEGHLNSECIWIEYWVELPTAAAVRDYRQYLASYAADQKRSGRFNWEAQTALYDVPAWLAREKVVPSEIRVSTLVAGGCLLVCLVNSVGLMLAKLSGRANELGVRRALGASKAAIFLQCVVESAVVGLAGGLLGLILTKVGLSIERTILSDDIARLAHLNSGAILITLSLSVLVTVLSGLYPSWRASRVQPAWQLKAQ
jgi:putative ABC transport system permease protein